MAFKFSLATVLKYRAEIEKREERTLEVRREAVSHLESKLAAAREGRSRILLDRDASLNRGVLGDDLRHLGEQQRQLERLELQLRSELKTALVELDKQMKAFLAARQQREILSELKLSQNAKYEEQRERREQATIDEIFNARMHRDT